MINLRQIAVLFGTGAAVAGVLALPDQAISTESAQVRFREAEPSPILAEGSPAPNRKLASVDQPEDPKTSSAAPVTAQISIEEKIASAKARVVKAAERLNAIRLAQAIPASVEITTSPPEFSRHSDLTFAPEVSFSRVDGSGISNNSTARLLSGMNLGGNLTWRQHWSEKLKTYIGLGFSRVDFQGAPNSKTIEQKGKTFGRMQVGASYCVDDRWEVGTGVGMRQEVFYVATGATSLRVDQVAVPRAEASVRYDLIKLSPFRMGMGARSAYLFPAGADGYSVKAGSSHRFSVHIKEENTEGRLRPTGEIFYDWKKQDTNLNRKTEKEIGLQLGFTWKFGP